MQTLKFLAINAISRVKLWLNLKNSWPESSKIFCNMKSTKYSTQVIRQKAEKYFKL